MHGEVFRLQHAMALSCTGLLGKKSPVGEEVEGEEEGVHMSLSGCHGIATPTGTVCFVCVSRADNQNISISVSPPLSIPVPERYVFQYCVCNIL